MSEQFRIGGVYRNGQGDVVTLRSSDDYEDFPVRSYFLDPARNPGGAGHHRLSDGRAKVWFADQSLRYDLLPGEMHQVDGQWVPITSLPADATEQAEIDAAKCQPAHVSHVEPERKPLDWNKSTPFDSFPGYEVFSDAVSSGFVPAQPKAPLHPLQKMNEGGNALHGSAALLKD
jgi:hypothetical protein